MKISLRLQPKQALIWEKINNDYYGRDNKPVHTIMSMGGARGGMKSHSIRNVILLRRLMYPGTTGLIFRKTVKDLEENHVWPMLEEHPDLSPYYNEQKKVLRLPNGSRITFGYAERDADVERFLGHAYDDMGLDQVESISEYSTKYLLSTNRRSSASSAIRVPKALLSWNPGGIGAAYLKRIFVDKIYTEKERAENYFFVKSYLWDNFFWAQEAGMKNVSMEEYQFKWPEEKRKQFCLDYAPYVERLNEQPEHVRRAWIYGDLDTFMGQFFGMFLREVHCISSGDLAWGTQIPPDYTATAGLDYGNATVMEVVYRDYDGVAYCDHELRQDGTIMSSWERANQTAQHLKAIGRPGMVVWGDVNMKIPSGVDIRSKDTPYDVYRRAGVNVRIVSKTRDTDGRRPRIMFNRLLRDAMSWSKTKDGEWKTKPRLFFVEDRCPSIVRTLPQLMTDKTDTEDFETPAGIEDHDTDALKYGYANLNRSYRRIDEPAEEKEDFSYRQIPAASNVSHTGFDYASFL